VGDLTSQLHLLLHRGVGRRVEARRGVHPTFCSYQTSSWVRERKCYNQSHFSLFFLFWITKMHVNYSAFFFSFLIIKCNFGSHVCAEWCRPMGNPRQAWKSFANRWVCPFPGWYLQHSPPERNRNKGPAMNQNGMYTHSNDSWCNPPSPTTTLYGNKISPKAVAAHNQ
jgi:hypothetical protein